MKIGFVGRLILGSCLFSLLVVAGVEIALAQAEEKLGPNLIENGDFEAANAEDTWGLDTPDRQQMMTEGAHGGKKCLKLMCLGEGNSNRSHKKGVKIDPAKTYWIACWVKVKGEGVFFLRIKTATGNKPGEPGVRECVGMADTKGEWKKVEMEYRLLADEKGVETIMPNLRVHGKAEALIDDIEVREKTGASGAKEDGPAPVPQEKKPDTEASKPDSHVPAGPEYDAQSYPLIHSAGLRLSNIPENLATAELKYRKKGDASWRDALPLVRAVASKMFYDSRSYGVAASTIWTSPIVTRFIGGLFHLEPSTEYEFELACKDKDGKVLKMLSGAFRTRRDEVTYGKGKTLTVGDGGMTIDVVMAEAKPGDTVLLKAGIYSPVKVACSGEPGNPITIRGEKGAVISGGGALESGDASIGLHIPNCHDLIVENLKMANNGGYHVFIDSDCKRIVFQHCEIEMKGGEKYGLRVKNTDDCIVQYNNIHGTGAKCPTSFQGNWGFICRYNLVKFSGSPTDMWQFRVHSDTDIYENWVTGGAGDDSELEEGNNINVKFWRNILDSRGGHKGTISHTPVCVGPVYIFDNVFLCANQFVKTVRSGISSALSDGTGDVAYAIPEHKGKAARFVDFGLVLYYNNTVYRTPDSPLKGSSTGAPAFWRGQGFHARITFVNNIFCGLVPSTKEECDAIRTEPRSAAGYGDFHFENNLTDHDPKGLFTCENDTDFRLKEGSPALDKGLVIPNITDGFKGKAPDMGAFEAGENWVQEVMTRKKKCGVN